VPGSGHFIEDLNLDLHRLSMKVLERVLTPEGVQLLLDLCIGPELGSRAHRRDGRRKVLFDAFL